MKIIAANSKAVHDYLITEKIEAGIVLTGAEVKSLRINTGSIRGSYIVEKDGELWLLNSFIKKYNNSSLKDNYDPTRQRKLLISRKQFNKISGILKQGGLSLIAISLYFNENGLVKISFGIGKGKKKYDKRQSIKEKDWNLRKDRMVKNK